MANLGTFDPKRVSIIFGSHVVTGYAEDTFVSSEPQGDGTVSQAGADGEVARSISNNPLHRITITLQQTSRSNDYFSDVWARDRASGGGGVQPLQIRDLRGTTLLAASQAWIVNLPTIEFGATLSDRAWVIDAVVSDAVLGGNNA